MAFVNVIAGTRCCANQGTRLCPQCTTVKARPQIFGHAFTL